VRRGSSTTLISGESRDLVRSVKLVVVVGPHQVPDRVPVLAPLSVPLPRSVRLGPEGVVVFGVCVLLLVQFPPSTLLPFPIGDFLSCGRDPLDGLVRLGPEGVVVMAA
jgi:hypothetical protein